MDCIFHFNSERQNPTIKAAYLISKLAIAVAVITVLSSDAQFKERGAAKKSKQGMYCVWF